ncbi:hypothetical protein [Micromonospora sp. NPDC049891]
MTSACALNRAHGLVVTDPGDDGVEVEVLGRDRRAAGQHRQVAQ